MPREFNDDPHEPAGAQDSSADERQHAAEGEEDSLEFARQNEPPRGLMRKRPPLALWILAALVLGGLIALLLVGLSSG